MQPIIFVHGFMEDGNCFNQWKFFFENKGYQCYNPTWVNHSKTSSDKEKVQTDLNAVINGYIELIDTLDTKPILIGHSLGGIIIQKLIEDNKGCLGITLTSGPPKGIITFQKDWIISNFKIMNPFNRNPLVLMDPSWYNTYVTNEMSLSETKAFLEQNAIKSSKLVAKSISKQGQIDFSKPHVPLLFISGELDRSQPPIIQEKNAKAYSHQSSTTDWITFSNRTHNIHLQEGWQEIAEYCCQWILKLS
ncbi:MAG: alpha/beta hydrolase [Streptococcus sp.]|nr:alpha/beta hydrolase [Streptococcus sp.]